MPQRRNPGESDARATLRDAIEAGALPAAARCLACEAGQGVTTRGLPVVVYHHPRGYLGDPFDVVELCRRCHALVHAGSIIDPGLGEKRPRPDYEARAAKTLASRRASDARHSLRAFGPDPGESAPAGV